MAQIRADAIVLGAGMVGVSIALHLQQRGRSVVLVDRRGAGEETSFGNAGLIERASIFPLMFPREVGAILRYALNRTPEAHYVWRDAPYFAPWLARYFLASSPAGAASSAAAERPLIERCIDEHEALVAQAGAGHLLHRTGWIKLYRTQSSLDAGLAEADRLRPFGVRFDILDRAAIAEREPHLRGEIAGGVHFLDPASVSDPGGLTRAYAELFERRGGRFLTGDARSVETDPAGWKVATSAGPVLARDVVAALGPWSDLVFRKFGYSIPLGVKRGYHVHIAPADGAVLNRPVLDTAGGYVLAPMRQGIRLTTGAQFARRDSAPDPVPVARTEPMARALFPLGARIEAQPWMGSRPCLPDMVPILGEAPRHKGLWFAFGHQHHGFTLGPVSGRLMAEMICGEPTVVDPSPYRMERFG